jgi:quercetin dioxygenase-like cupin family protein
VIKLQGGKSHRAESHTHDANEAALVISGRMWFKVGSEEFELGQGDSVYYDAREPHAYGSASEQEEATMIWVCTERSAT